MRKGSTLPLFLILAVLVILFLGYLIWQNNSSVPLYTTKPPTGINQEEGSSSSTGAKSIDPNQSGLAVYPDKAIDFDLSSTISVNSLITHRSALNEKTIKVHGFVVAFKQGYSPGTGLGIPATLPTVTIADSGGNQRDTHYDLQVVLANNQTTYTKDQEVTIKGIVSGNKWLVSLRSY